jgi:hypothetical protein
MLAKCANPSCSTPLLYLREGKIFMVELLQPAKPAVPAKPVVVEQSAPKPPNRVEHFWLCGPCSASMTLTRDRRGGVQVVRKDAHSLGAAAS